jgi:DNA-binding MarR family transcriptional regulator
MAPVNSPAVGVAFLLSQVGAHAAGCFEQRLSKIGLTPQHVGLLRMLGSNGGMTQQAMAELFGIFPSRMVLLLDELEEKKLVRRQSNPSDRRSYQVYLTAAGGRCVQRIADITQELEKDLLHSLTENEREVLDSQLRRIVSQQKITPAVHPAYRNREARRANQATKIKESNRA